MEPDLLSFLTLITNFITIRRSAWGFRILGIRQTQNLCAKKNRHLTWTRSYVWERTAIIILTRRTKATTINIAYIIVARKSDVDSEVLKISSSVIPKSVQTRCFTILYQLKMKSVRELDQETWTVTGTPFNFFIKLITPKNKTNWKTRK